MEKLLVSITKLHDKYKNSPKTIEKLQYYIDNQIPPIMEQYNKHLKNKLLIEKKTKDYVDKFLNCSNKQFFFIAKTEIFIKYDGVNFQIINEDDIWYSIYTELSRIPILLDYKEKIKDVVINEIKQNNLFNSMPESNTIQQTIHQYIPHLFDTKIQAKYFFSLLGDNILKKNKNIIHYCDEDLKPFFDTLNLLFKDYFGENVNIKHSFRFRYNEAHDYKNCRILKTNKNFSKNILYQQDNLLKNKHIFNLISVSTHYSKRYGCSDKYMKDQGTSQLIQHIYYLENKTGEKIIDDFLNQSNAFIKKQDSNITKKDMYFLWINFLKDLHLPNVLYKSKFFNIIEKKLEFNEQFKNIYNKSLGIINQFKDFWNTNIQNGEMINDEYEISEILQLFRNTNMTDQLDEDDIIYIVKYYYNNVNINGKNINNIFSPLWDKMNDMREAIINKFNIDITTNIKMKDAYCFYCNYSKNNKLIVSKKYFEKYINNIIPEEFIENNYIKLEFWN
tara:strand:- start:2652 stop:4160 length:1509 start_codon:yes stop_codon:yes gene_type:complete